MLGPVGIRLGRPWRRKRKKWGLNGGNLGRRRRRHLSSFCSNSSHFRKGSRDAVSLTFLQRGEFHWKQRKAKEEAAVTKHEGIVTKKQGPPSQIRAGPPAPTQNALAISAFLQSERVSMPSLTFRSWREEWGNLLGHPCHFQLVLNQFPCSQTES